APFRGVTDWYQKAKVIVNQESVGTSQIYWFGRIPTLVPFVTPVASTTLRATPIVPPSPDYTPASLDYSPASDTESDPSEDPSSRQVSPLPSTSPFVFIYSSDDDTPIDTPPSPTPDTPPAEIAPLVIQTVPTSPILTVNLI
ncbi:hypothetical protein Tco_1342387, partial [Tanacetum coccineum]